MKILVPGGERDMIIRPVVITTTDARTGKKVTGFMPGMGGSCPAGMVGTGGTGSWVNPMNSYMITQPYHADHNGIDLGAPVGTPVYAADSGMVIFSGWNDWGYGVLVVLDHAMAGRRIMPILTHGLSIVEISSRAASTLVGWAQPATAAALTCTSRCAGGTLRITRQVISAFSNLSFVQTSKRQL
jgi:hypothetical protein